MKQLLQQKDYLKISVMFFIFTLCIEFDVNAQSNDVVIEKWYTQVNETESPFLSDLTKVFYNRNCSYIGIYGSNHHKISLYFEDVNKKDEYTYEVKGYSKFKDNVCSFKGNIFVSKIQFLHYECSDIELNIIFLAYGSYELYEEGESSGTFKGKFKKHFHYYPYTDSISIKLDFEVSSNEGFAGTWKSNKTGKVCDCHFGFYRYPYEIAGDFDGRGGEPLINPKYKKYGWEKHFDSEYPYMGYYWPYECDDKWWLTQ